MILVIAAVVGLALQASSKFDKEQVDSVIGSSATTDNAATGIETGLTEPESNTRSDGSSQTTPPEGTSIQPPQCSLPSGFFSIVYSAKKRLTLYTGDVAGVFKYTGNCEADIYLEAGIVNSPKPIAFSFLPSQFEIQATGRNSNCDGNIHYNGAVYHVKPGQDIKFRFTPYNYGAEGNYPLNIGAYWGGTKNGCLANGGTTLAELHSDVSFSNRYSLLDAKSSYEIVK